MAKQNFTQATYDVDNVQGLPDVVKDQSNVLKQTFDKASLDGRTFINDTLLVELAQTILNNSGSNKIGHNSTDITADNVSDALEELQQAIQDIIAGEIAVNTITNELLAGDVKVGSLASLTTTEKSNVVAAINENQTILDDALSMSALFNGLELDDDDKLSLWKNPQTESKVDQNITFSETAIYNTTKNVAFGNPFDYGRLLIVSCYSDVNPERSLLHFINMRSGKCVVTIGSDYNGNLKVHQGEFGERINASTDIGSGVFTNDTSDDFTATVEFDDNYGSWGGVSVKLAGINNYPHDFDFNISYIGVV